MVLRQLPVALILVGLTAADTAERPAQYHRGPSGHLLPDPTVTPGVVALHITQQVCSTRWGLDRRHVTDAMRRAVYAAYAVTPEPGICCEIDHLISRELGGADHIRNLWPQPWAEARLKDRLENAMHREVCAGTLPLRTAQWAVATDWGSEYQRRFTTPKATP